MAYAPEIRNEAKIQYVRDRLPMEQVAVNLGIPAATVRRWRDAAKIDGDDWDKLRAAVVLAGGDVGAMSQQVAVEMMIQFNSVLELLKADEKMNALERAQTLASITDSMTKARKFMAQSMPEEARLATAMITLQALAEFIRDKHPGYLAAFTEILTPFGARLPDMIATAK